MSKINQTQNIKQNLKLKVVPQCIQLAKLLQIPESLMRQRIEEEMVNNPIIDVIDDDQNDNNDEINNDKQLDNFIIIDKNGTTNNKNIQKLFNLKQDNLTYDKTINEYLSDQLYALDLTPKECQVCLYLIGNLGKDGYLRDNNQTIINDILLSLNIEITSDELTIIINKLQTLDPPGIFARSLQECLKLQLINKWKSDSNVNISRAILIIRDYFDEFSKKHYDVIASKMNLSTYQIQKAISQILSLNPIPINNYKENSSNNLPIKPDFVIEYDQNNKLIPKLVKYNNLKIGINNTYQDMISQEKTDQNKDFIDYVKKNINNANNFIHALSEREVKLLKCMQLIIDIQYDYFTTGDIKQLKPIKLKDISDKLKFDISIISRIVSNKYVLTDYGLFSLKHFFSESIPTETGDNVSSNEIKEIIKDIVNNENHNKPYSDIQIVNILKDKGYKIARRTVTKYRDILNIPVCRLRKETIFKDKK